MELERKYGVLMEVATDLAKGLNSRHCFDRMLSGIRKVIRCDAIAALIVEGNLLRPIAAQGLSADTLGRRFEISDHPRFAQLCSVNKPFQFSNDCDLPDPYDGLLLAKDGDLPVHSCMGFPVWEDSELLGLITLDSLESNAFSKVDEKSMALLYGLINATFQTAVKLHKLTANATQAQAVVRELTKEALTRDGGELIGQSRAMQALKKDIQLVAGSDFTVLIQGPTGVGKELVARTLHQNSARKNNPLVYLNCASLPESLAESELFGHAKGAFSGADRERPGKFLLANGGTIFLDEIGELPLTVQSKLLRVLQSGEIQPVGKDLVQQVNVRVLAATNRELKNEVEAGHFREDLFHRLSVYPLYIPPLSERDGDVLLLAGYFLELTARKLGARQLKLSSRAMSKLTNYHWPGNVRELEHVISRAALKAIGASGRGTITRIDAELLDINVGINLPERGDQTTQSFTDKRGDNSEVFSAGLKPATEMFQKQMILNALDKSGGNWSAAARELKLDRANLIRLSKRLGIHIDKRIRVFDKN